MVIFYIALGIGLFIAFLFWCDVRNRQRLKRVSEMNEELKEQAQESAARLLNGGLMEGKLNMVTIQSRHVRTARLEWTIISIVPGVRPISDTEEDLTITMFIILDLRNVYQLVTKESIENPLLDGVIPFDKFIQRVADRMYDIEQEQFKETTSKIPSFPITMTGI